RTVNNTMFMKYLITLLIIPIFINLQAQQPTADFMTNTPTVCFGETVAFTDQSSGNNLTYTWNFGDGNSSTVKNPSHIYNAPGNYSITLVVTNGAGKSDSKVKSNYITVNPLPEPSFSVNGNSCTVPI